MSYWENRRAKEMYEAMESAEATAKDIRDIYAKASRELNFQIAEIYERYQNKFNISEAEALMLLNQDITPDRIRELSEKLAELKGLEANEVLKELESPAYRKRIERLQQLQTNIDKMMRDVYKQEKLVSTDHYVEQYGNSYYHEVFDIMNATGLDYSFSYVDPKELNHIVNSNWSGANYSQRIWGNTQALAEDLKTQLAIGYLTGKPERDISMDLANEYATGAANARRLVRTESAYISNQAVAAADKDAGIDKYRICAVLDLKTSEICREQDGQEYEYDDMEVGVNYPPFHPYCRTTVLSVLDDDCLEGLARRARDPITGESKKIPANTTYKEWYAENVANNPEALFAEQVEKHRGADVAQYERYVERLGKKEVGSIDEFRVKKYKNPEEYENTKREYADTGEFKRHKELLGEMEGLENIAAFKELKYNNPERWNVIHTAYLDKRLKAKIRTEEYNKTIHQGKQGKHIKGHNNFTEGRSYLTITMEQAQEIVDKYAGSGEIIRTAAGKFNNSERIVLDRDIGVYVGLDGTEEATNVFTIRYSKDGTHIVPARRLS